MSIFFLIVVVVAALYLLWWGLAMKVTAGGNLGVVLFKVLPLALSFGLGELAFKLSQLPL